jgi:hypothetical protein
LPKGVDLRSAEGRRFLRLVENYSAELGGSLSEVERVMVKQAAGISMRCEILQARMVRATLGTSPSRSCLRCPT